MTSPGNHILPHYDAALNAIRLRVNAICGSLLKYMDILERVISGPDSDGANSIIADSDPQFHPLGRDLRLVITFSRCGDKLQECMEEITGIAKHAKASIRHQESLSPDIVLPLLEMAVSEFRDAARCLETQDVDAAREIRLRDKKLDKAHRKALALLVSPEREDSSSLNVNLLFIIRSLERIGDIAKTIAATVVFVKEATDIRPGRER